MIRAFAVIFNPYILLGSIFFLLWYYTTSTFGFWKCRNVKFKKPIPFFGNIGKFALLRQPFHETMHEFYTYFRDEPYGGIFQMRDPILFLRDPDLVHMVLVKDFKTFIDRGMKLLNPNRELNPLSLHLFSSEGDEWRGLRRKISPIFTTGKLKGMHNQMQDCMEKLNVLLEREINEKKGGLDLKLILERLTTDIIGSCAFGIECSSLEKNDQFTNFGRKVLKPTWVTSARVLVSVISPKLLKVMKLPDIPEDTKKFFLDLVLSTMKYRRQNKISRCDLLDLLMGLQNAHVDPQYAPDEYKDSGLDDDTRFDEILIAANSLLFFIAGFETSSSTLSYCLYELAINEKIQDRLLEEVKNVYNKNNQCFSVDTVKEIPYLDAVISETLRKYPPFGWLPRQAKEDWLIPGSKTVLPKGTSVIIPTWSIHHDWRHYPNPELFDPERFYGENAKNIREGTYLPFGDGPRNCVGARFAKMELRLALADLILKYKVSPCSRTKIPLDYELGNVLVASKDGIWVNLEKRTA